jgi:hypothetical protein
MSAKFEYQDLGKGFLGPIKRPIAKVTFKSPQLDTFVDVWLVVDTGADFTILPQHLAEKLRISLEKDCITDETLGVGGQQKIYLYKKKVKAKIGDMTREVPLAFFSNDDVPPLLGRCGFLETFDTEFLKSHIVMFKG